MGGNPMFRGTRVPVQFRLFIKDDSAQGEGISRAEISALAEEMSRPYPETVSSNRAETRQLYRSNTEFFNSIKKEGTPASLHP
jgi:hypothetical protein